MTVRISQIRTESFFPALLTPCRRIDVALHALVMPAYVEGVSTRRVDDLVAAMGGTGHSTSEVSRICAHLAAWLTDAVDRFAIHASGQGKAVAERYDPAAALGLLPHDLPERPTTTALVAVLLRSVGRPSS